MTKTILKTLDLVAQAIFDKKGFNIIALDVRGFSTMTDFFIIAEGNINRHIKGIAQTIEDVLRESGHKIMHIEGAKTSDWIVMDYSDIVIHLFTSELREKYSLEQLWKEAKIVDLHIDVKEKEKDK